VKKGSVPTTIEGKRVAVNQDIGTSDTPVVWRANARRSSRLGSTVDWYRLLIVLGTVLPLAFFVLAGWKSYRDEWLDAEHKVDVASRIAAEHASKVFETAQLLTGRMRDLVTSPQMSRSDEAGLHLALKHIVSDIPQVQAVWAWDASGNLTASGRYYPLPRSLNVADREYFKRLRDGAGSFISGTISGRISNERLFNYTERLDGDNGQFNGVLSVSLDVPYFENFYQELAGSQPGLSLSLVRSDGLLVLRYPSVPGESKPVSGASPLTEALRDGSKSGSFRGFGTVEDKVKQVSYRALDPYPIYVVASIDGDQVMAAWRNALLRLAAIIFPASLCLVGVAWLAMRKSSGEVAALARLADEERRRAQAESALRHSQHLEALGRLTGGVAHDFNNLLMVVNNQAYLLKKKLAGTPAETQLSAIERAVKTGERLTRQLLAFARRQPLRSERIELQHKLPQMEQMLRHSLSPEIKLIVNVDGDTHPIYADSSELELSLLNLAINAKDAMPRGGVVTLLARNATPEESPDTNEPFVNITISDTGHGIPRQTLERVFEPFFTTKGVGSSTGLGLSQVQGFCVQSGGSVKIDSTEQVGTTVRLLLPATQRQELPSAQALPHVRQSGFGERVLLVEDNDEVAQTTLALIKALGYDAQRVTNAKEALRYLSSGKALDVVLSDVVMPGNISGIELAKMLKQRHPRLPVVLMSGYTQGLTELDKGTFQVLSKPVAPDTLGAALATAVRPPHVVPELG
jgi:signal transduction histidine kinase/ActR/RegA family two-component response regulator